VDQQPLVEQQQASELARLDDAALAVLARNRDADAGRCPLSVAAFAERALEDVLLPLIQNQPVRRSKVDDVLPGVLSGVRREPYSRLRYAESHASP
jgi:hypothetical protein